MKGLRLEIKAELRLMRPEGLGQIMQLAQLIEDRNKVKRGGREQFGPRENRVAMTQNVRPNEQFATQAVAVRERPSIQRSEQSSKLTSPPVPKIPS